MADKTEKQHDLGVLEEDDEFEEFPAEDWKVRDRNMILSHLFFIKIYLTVYGLLIIYYSRIIPFNFLIIKKLNSEIKIIGIFSCHVKNIINKGKFFFE